MHGQSQKENSGLVRRRFDRGDISAATLVTLLDTKSPRLTQNLRQWDCSENCVNEGTPVGDNNPYHRMPTAN